MEGVRIVDTLRDAILANPDKPAEISVRESIGKIATESPGLAIGPSNPAYFRAMLEIAVSGARDMGWDGIVYETEK